MRNLNEDHDTVAKKVFKDRKQEKMAVDNENLYSSSSDDDDISKTVAPTLQHVFNHKFFNDMKRKPMRQITEMTQDDDGQMTERINFPKSRNTLDEKTQNPTNVTELLDVFNPKK